MEGISGLFGMSLESTILRREKLSATIKCSSAGDSRSPMEAPSCLVAQASQLGKTCGANIDDAL
jgi:hypothetical protein